MTKRVSLGIVALLVACGADDTTSAPSPAASSKPASNRAEITSIADAVEIDELEVLQGTTVTLLTDASEPAKRNAPIIANRPGFIRAHARLNADSHAFKAPILSAELHVSYPGKDDLVMNAGPLTVAAFDPVDMQTTFNFDLPAEAFTPDARVSVTVTSPKLPSDPGIVYPADGTTVLLGARDTAPTLKVQLVPVKYNEDGSGREPTLDDAQVQAYKDALFKMYPVANIEIGVHAALPWASKVEGGGEGWNSLLSAVMGVRRADKPPSDTYYVGVLKPAASLGEYCDQGCILGLAPMGDLIASGARVAMIVGFGMKSEGGTLAQELAHAMGRFHADCGNPQSVDPDYPYGRGSIGVPGFDILAKSIVDPDGRYHDFMSYCSPVWTSDYTFGGIFSWMEDVAAQKKKTVDLDTVGPEVFGASSFTFDGKQTLAIGEAVDTTDAIHPTPGVTVRWETANGVSLGSAPAAYRPYDTLPGGLVIVPNAPAEAIVTRIEGLAAVPLAIRQKSKTSSSHGSIAPD